jgi:dTDP-4-dehydrorhamnose reductase
MNILILGHTGKMGTALIDVLGDDHTLHCMGRDDFNAHQPFEVIDFVKDNPIDVIINAVAHIGIDPCEEDYAEAILVNTTFPNILALLANEVNCKLVHFSTDAVFPNGGPYFESDKPDPLNVYGLSKSLADKCIPHIHEKHYICRLSILFGETPKKNQFVEKMLAHEGDLKIADDIISSPTYSKDVAREVKWLLETEKPYGLYHLANFGEASLYDLMKEILENLQSERKISRVSYRDFPHVGEKNTRTPLSSEKIIMRHWRDAVKEYCDNIRGDYGR